MSLKLNIYGNSFFYFFIFACRKDTMILWLESRAVIFSLNHKWTKTYLLKWQINQDILIKVTDKPRHSLKRQINQNILVKVTDKPKHFSYSHKDIGGLFAEVTNIFERTPWSHKYTGILWRLNNFYHERTLSVIQELKWCTVQVQR